ncbi:MAG TPA: alpha/beta fold hydrolase [Actinophytocola sp.]|uniref:alpha/beta fold hydrolase n=1 Tax=Actinophytocola sp. TaxID=1872138 RepID=UPI002E02CECC|nr:alpha/beta fold hydrolase [Actinophytocola sp.]
MQLTEPQLQTVTLDDGLNLAYRELGSGPPVLLLHGWPTSSYLWRNVMPVVARRNSVIALDLPGFGGSGKPVDVRYTFDFYERALDGLTAKLEMDDLGIAVHDLGGPIALHWMMRNPGRVTRLALLNTLVYPQLRPDLIEFLRTVSNPDTRDQLTGPDGLEGIMRTGLADPDHLTEDILAAVQHPFHTPEARQALALATLGLDPKEFAKIADWLPSLDIPVRIVYGERDQVLTDVADTMTRAAKDLPQAEVTTLPNAGHFLQEDEPERVGELLADFFAR